MRFILRWFCGVCSLYLADYLLYGFWCDSVETAIAAGAVLMLIYWVFRPVLHFLLGIFNLLTLGFLYAALDAGFIYFITLLFPGKIYYQNIGWLFLAALIVNVVRGIADLLFSKRRR